MSSATQEGRVSRHHSGSRCPTLRALVRVAVQRQGAGARRDVVADALREQEGQGRCGVVSDPRQRLQTGFLGALRNARPPDRPTARPTDLVSVAHEAVEDDQRLGRTDPALAGACALHQPLDDLRRGHITAEGEAEQRWRRKGQGE